MVRNIAVFLLALTAVDVLAARTFLENGGRFDRAQTLSLLETAMEMESDQTQQQLQQASVPPLQPQTTNLDQFNTNRPRTLVHRILEIIFRQDAPVAIQHYDECVKQNADEIKEPTRQEIFLGARSIQGLCFEPDKEMLMHKLLTDMLAGIDRYITGCQVFEKEQDMLMARIQDLIAHYRSFLNDLGTDEVLAVTRIGQFKDLFGEIWPEIPDQIDRKLPTLQIISELKTTLMTLQLLNYDKAGKIMVAAKTQDPQSVFKQLYDGFNNDFKEMADMISNHMGDLCHSVNLYVDATNDFIKNFNGFVYEATGIFANDDFPLIN